MSDEGSRGGRARERIALRGALTCAKSRIVAHTRSTGACTRWAARPSLPFSATMVLSTSSPAASMVISFGVSLGSRTVDAPSCVARRSRVDTRAGAVMGPAPAAFTGCVPLGRRPGTGESGSESGCGDVVGAEVVAGAVDGAAVGAPAPGLSLVLSCSFSSCTCKMSVTLRATEIVTPSVGSKKDGACRSRPMAHISTRPRPFTTPARRSKRSTSGTMMRVTAMWCISSV